MKETEAQGSCAVPEGETVRFWGGESLSPVTATVMTVRIIVSGGSGRTVWGFDSPPVASPLLGTGSASPPVFVFLLGQQRILKFK